MTPSIRDTVTFRQISLLQKNISAKFDDVQVKFYQWTRKVANAQLLNNRTLIES